MQRNVTLADERSAMIAYRTMALLDDLQQALGNAYIIERELGGGGMSRVFVGEEVALGRKVAVKVLLPSSPPASALIAFSARSSSPRSSSTPTSFR
jgi:hypothetical protein